MAAKSDDAPQPSGPDAPALVDRSTDRSVDDVITCPTLSQRDRSLITISYLVALNRSTELPFHVKEALENGVSRHEVIELVAQLAHHAPQHYRLFDLLLGRRMRQKDHQS
jgi:4-carboxymuconolactone decarboxylase